MTAVLNTPSDYADDEQPSHWSDRAACKGLDTRLFFPGPKQTVDPAVLKVCWHSCEVREQCARHGIEHKEQGVWGGLSERDRREIRRQGSAATLVRNLPPPHGTPRRARWDRRHGIEPCKECLEALRAENRMYAQSREGQVIPAEKLCYRCKVTKSSADFNRRKNCPDGLQGMCRDCQHEVWAGK